MSTPNSSINTGYSSYPAQAIIAFIMLVVLHFLMFSAEYTYRLVKGVQKTQTDLIPFTASSAKMYSFPQDPANSNAKSIHLSDNERTGVEFSYSFFLYVDQSSFGNEDGLLHVFHKGYSCQYPLLGPGVYMHNNSNKLRVYMNTFENWNTYVDIENFPIKKWVHVVLMCEDNGMNVFVNGNIVKRINFEGSIPYQNFQSVHVFSQRRITVNGNLIPSLGGESFNVFGSISGSISMLTYYSYALSYTEINDILQAGPSKKTDPMSQDKPPYLTDDWWITSQ
jgi:hypothetical protein